MAKQPKVKTLGRKLRPSNADRYLNCPASVVGSADLPAGESTYYADKGTVVHTVIENCINTGRTPQSYIGEFVCEVEMEVDAEMAKSAQFCLDYINKQGFTQVEAEQMVELPWIKNPDGENTTGKVDFVGYDEDFEILKIGDYKNGYMPVEEDSYQFKMYAYALVMDRHSPYKHLSEFTTVLVQPNSKHGEIIAEKTWTKGDMIRLKAQIDFATRWVKQTKVEDLKEKDYCEGSWCKFCPLASADAGERMCPKKTKALFDDESGQEAIELAKPAALPAPSKMTREQRALVLGKRKDIKKWLDDVYKLELANAEAGDVPPGMKLAEGRRKTRYWMKGIDEADVSQALMDAGLMQEEIMDEKLISPATAKKLLKKIPPELEAYMTPDEKSVELVEAEDASELFD